MYLAFVLLFSFCCVALLYFLFITHHDSKNVHLFELSCRVTACSDYFGKASHYSSTFNLFAFNVEPPTGFQRTFRFSYSPGFTRGYQYFAPTGQRSHYANSFRATPCLCDNNSFSTTLSLYAICIFLDTLSFQFNGNL